MIELFEQTIRTADRQSSKGNQLKWENNDIWYKADYSGYEGLAEYVVSNLLRFSSLDESEFVIYKPEQIKYKKALYNGVSSTNFVEEDWQIVTLERLFKTKYNKSLYEEVWHIADCRERYKFLCSIVKNMTGLEEFDKYLCKLITIDAFFLNEDRHMHNIAVLMNSKQEFDYCRIFDNGACLLSDTTMDYPLGNDIYELMEDCHSKTISRDFDEQLDVAEVIAGNSIRFHFTKKDVKDIVYSNTLYSDEIKQRVETIVYSQMGKYKYLFE